MVPDLRCGCCGDMGHIRKFCPTGNTVCSICGKTGHRDQLCHSTSPPKQQQQQQQTWADRAKGNAHLQQPPAKPKLLPMEDGSWTAYCTKCDEASTTRRGTS